MAPLPSTRYPPHRGDHAFHLRDCGINVLRIEGERTDPGASSIHRSLCQLHRGSFRSFTVPAPWISAIIQIENAGDEHAIWLRGAIGLMQLMPATWVELSVRCELGLDPFDPKDNKMADTAYVRGLRDCFGSAGLLAACHAGPTRYEQHLTTGQPLSPETTATSPRSGHCSVTSRPIARHFASDVRVLGGKLRYFASARTLGDLHRDCSNITIHRSEYGSVFRIEAALR
jgi:hypothetical protein